MVPVPPKKSLQLFLRKMKRVDGVKYCWPGGCLDCKWECVDVKNKTIYCFPTCELMCRALNEKLRLTNDVWDSKLVYGVYHNRLGKKRLEDVKKHVMFNKN